MGATNKEDIFTVSSEIGNGALTYPVGLITSDEMVLAGGRGQITLEDVGHNCTYYLRSGAWYWTLSPHCFHITSTAMLIPVDGEGSLSVGIASNDGGIRPVVSLRAGAYYTLGDGTENTPYVIFE